MKRIVIIMTLLIAVFAANAQTVGGGGSKKYHSVKKSKTSTSTTAKHKTFNRNVFQPEFTFMLNYAYAFAPQHSVGLTLGQNKLGKTPLGWYINLMTGFDFNFGTVGSVSSEGVYNGYVMPFYTGKERRTRLSASLGMTVNMVIPLYFYMGVGYGYRSLTWEVVGGDWMTYEPMSFTGANVDFGLMLNIKGFALSAGYSTINFQYHELKAGIGFIIKTKKKKSVAMPAPNNPDNSNGSGNNTENN